MENIESSITSAVESWMSNFQPIALRLTKISYTASQACTSLFGCETQTDDVGTVLNPCWRIHNISIRNMLAALTGAAISTWVFEEFTWRHDTHSSVDIDEILSVLEPGKHRHDSP